MLKVLALPRGDIILERDVKLLRKHFEVRTAPAINHRKPIPDILEIFRGTLWADITFSWFADSHAFFAVLFSKILRKKSIVVVSGYEVAKEPEINYGAMLNPLYTWIVKFMLNYADKLFAVSEFTKNEILKYTNNKNIEIMCGSTIDHKKFKPNNKKENLVIATTTFVNHSTIKRVGFETFIRAAKQMPNVNFALIGELVDNSIEYLKESIPLNVTITGSVSEEEMLKWYQKAKVYCRLSYYDAFAVALVEAMLCECIPVTTNKGALPEIVGNTGFYVPYGDSEATVEAIQKALTSNKGKEARKRIEGMFLLDKKEKTLAEIGARSKEE